jgi:hypothetical protein
MYPGLYQSKRLYTGICLWVCILERLERALASILHIEFQAHTQPFVKEPQRDVAFSKCCHHDIHIIIAQAACTRSRTSVGSMQQQQQQLLLLLPHSSINIQQVFVRVKECARRQFTADAIEILWAVDLCL